jgi:hypothetical protein
MHTRKLFSAHITSQANSAFAVLRHIIRAITPGELWQRFSAASNSGIGSLLMRQLFQVSV